MAPPKRPWFRMYCDVFTNPAVRALPAAQRWLWGGLMGLARTSPVPGALLDKASEPLSWPAIADYAAVSVPQAKTGVARFRAYGWLEVQEDVIVLTGWDNRQFESDDVTARTSKHRRRNVPGGDDGTFHDLSMERASVTGPEVQRTEQSQVSSSGTPVGAPPDDDDVIDEAMKILAQRDLERVTAEQGPRGDDDRWLVAARKRRLSKHRVEAHAIVAAEPSITAAELAARLEPADTAKPHPLDEAQRAQYADASKGLDRVRSVLADAEPDADERRAVLGRQREARSA